VEHQSDSSKILTDVGEVFDVIGGADTLRELTDYFYDKIMEDPILKEMFEFSHKKLDSSLEEGKRRQFLFLQQRFGGPRDYESLRGHPMLRKRHVHFKIGFKERDAWFNLMMESLDYVGITKDHPARSVIENYFGKTATHMINQQGSRLL